jgi:hypothetical protein
MRKLVVACGALAAIIFAACAPSPPELCKSGITTTCSRQFECQDDATKNSDIFKGSFGTSTTECQTKLEAFAKCDDKKTENELCVKIGADGGVTNGTFHLDKASECSNATKALSCADYKIQLSDPTKAPAACAGKCTF